MAYNSKYTGAQVEAQLDKVDGKADKTYVDAEVADAKEYASGEISSVREDLEAADQDMKLYVDEQALASKDYTDLKTADKYTKPASGIPASDLAPDVFLQGEKGDKGDKGDTGATGPQGVGVASVVQTTTSSADGGSNVVTVTLSDGKTSTFTVKNGSKGSQGEKGDKGDTGAEGPQGVQGIQGIQGPKGDTGADGAQGPKGDKGDKGDTGAAGTNGTNGVSVSSVTQTTTSTADGGTNVVTVTLSNGTTSTFNVKNGSKGSNGTNGTNGATFTPSVDANGNLSWTNNGGLTNPPTVNIKGPKGDKGDAGSGGSGGGSGAYAEVNHGTSDTTFTLTPNTFHVWDEVASLTLTLGSEQSGVANEYVFQFTSGATATSLTLPDDIKWANGTAPTIAENMIYQISILNGLAVVLEFSNAATLITNVGTYNAGNMMSGATLTFQYPIVSDLTLSMSNAASSGIVMPAGSQTITIDWFEPMAPVVESISPLKDSVYLYILV